MDKSFWIDEKCNACGICATVCPCRNIRLDGAGRPTWSHQCEQCLACIQWCPRKAIHIRQANSPIRTLPTTRRTPSGKSWTGRYPTNHWIIT
jgi:MinD superfamily P-loop ATPase